MTTDPFKPLPMVTDEWLQRAAARDQAFITILDGLSVLVRSQYAPGAGREEHFAKLKADLFAFLVAVEAAKSMLSPAAKLEEN